MASDASNHPSLPPKILKCVLLSSFQTSPNCGVRRGLGSHCGGQWEAKNSKQGAGEMRSAF